MNLMVVFIKYIVWCFFPNVLFSLPYNCLRTIESIICTQSVYHFRKITIVLNIEFISNIIKKLFLKSYVLCTMQIECARLIKTNS